VLTQTQKVAIRRHLGVPFAGTAQAGRLMGWRFTWYNEDLEYRMNNLQAPEQQLLTGVSLGSYRLGGMPSVGDVISYLLNDGVTRSASYTVQPSDFAAPSNPVNPSESSPLYSIALNSALAENAVLAAFGYAAVGSMPADLFSPQYLAPYFAELLVLGSNANAFALSGSVVGTTNLTVSNPGTPCPIAATFTNAATGQQTTCYGIIAICDYLAMGMTQQQLGLWLNSASAAGGAGAQFRPDELRARRALYREYTDQLSRMLGGEEYVRKFGGRSNGGSVA
jgi:hypothetical protein